MKLRQHCGFEESLETIVTIEPTKEALVAEIRKNSWIEISENDVKVSYYTFDKRINWETYIVEIIGWGVYGFTDGPLKD